MQGTADFRNHITHIVFKHPNRVFQDTTTLDTARNVFDPYPTSGMRLIVSFLFSGQGAAAWLLVRRAAGDPLKREGKEAQVLQQFAVGR